MSKLSFCYQFNRLSRNKNVRRIALANRGHVARLEDGKDDGEHDGNCERIPRDTHFNQRLAFQNQALA